MKNFTDSSGIPAKGPRQGHGFSEKPLRARATRQRPAPKTKAMKTGTNLLVAIIGMTILSAWATKQANDLKKAEWLIGTWENKSPKGVVYETWGKANDNELSGKSYIVRDSDTIVFETIRLLQEQDQLLYIPTVKNQNDGLPVRFVAKEQSATRLVFENPQHDFPQIISYTRIGTDSLVAEISGTQNGRERKQTFPMKRTK